MEKQNHPFTEAVDVLAKAGPASGFDRMDERHAQTIARLRARVEHWDGVGQEYLDSGETADGAIALAVAAALAEVMRAMEGGQ